MSYKQFDTGNMELGSLEVIFYYYSNHKCVTVRVSGPALVGVGEKSSIQRVPSGMSSPVLHAIPGCKNGQLASSIQTMNRSDSDPPPCRFSDPWDNKSVQ